MQAMPPSPSEHQSIAYLRSPQAIRDRCYALFDLALQDKLENFSCDLSQLDRVADYVIDVMQAAYPDLEIPFHSRWRHFEAGGVDRLATLNRLLVDCSPVERAKAKFDLAITSVLLDAGAGASWHYVEPEPDIKPDIKPERGKRFERSEGLAVASFHWFLQGGFSHQQQFPLQATAEGLQQITTAQLAEAFQVSDTNPLVGVAGRTRLMQQLGQVLSQSPQLFGDLPRLGNLVDYLLSQAKNHQLPATTVFDAVLTGLSEIWSGRVTIGSVNLGDVWRHSALPENGTGSQLVPFHKLSQWLTYSLLEPLQELGLQITHLDRLTGLPEYRNGGLCLDLGLLHPKHEAVTNQAHSVESEVIVEWRALTVVLLDRIADQIRVKLNLNEQSFPLVKILEGGTWAAGRKIAAELRSGGIPPIQIISDGTVF